MRAPTRGNATTIDLLQVNWVALTGDDTGSSTILSYNLQWDNGTNAVSWFDLIGDGVTYPYSTVVSANFTNGIVAGTQYKMRIRAYNALGWS